MDMVIRLLVEIILVHIGAEELHYVLFTGGKKVARKLGPQGRVLWQRLVQLHHRVFRVTVEVMPQTGSGPEDTSDIDG